MNKSVKIVTVNLLHDWWPHITAGVALVTGWFMRDKVLEIVKIFIERVIPNHAKALEDHETKDTERFSDVKFSIADAKGDILQALNQNIGYIRDDIKIVRDDQRADREATAKRVEFLEKVFLDSRLQ